MKVRDIMTSSVSTTSPNETVRRLWKVIFSKHINAMPVVDRQKRLLGIITKEDLLKALYPKYEEYFEDITSLGDFEQMESKIREIGNLKASDVMGKRVIYTREDTPIMRALSRMIVRRVNQLPVISARDTVVGVVTKGDIFYALVKKEMHRASSSARNGKKSASSR